MSKLPSFLKSPKKLLEKLKERNSKAKEKQAKRNEHLTELRVLEEKYGVDFAGYVPDTKELGTDSAFCNGYEAAYPMPEIFNFLNIKEGDTLLDVGSGKGYAMYLFSTFPFSRIDGVELSKKLVEISRANLSKLFPEQEGRFTVYCENALDFDRLGEYNYIFMYNPFPRDVIEQFVEKLSAVALSREEKITVIYQNPQRGSLFEESGAFKTVLIKDGTAIFESK